MHDNSGSVEDSRSGTRFLVDPPIAGRLGATRLRISDFGEGGMQAEHAEPMKIGTRGDLVVDLPRGPAGVTVGVAVAWSRLSGRAEDKGKLFYRTGFRITADVETSRQWVRTLLDSCFARPDSDSLEKKREKMQKRAQTIEDRTRVRVIKQQGRIIASDVILLIQHARTLLAANPDEAQKWYNRARFSLPAKAAPIHHREEILAVWEYLERSVSIEDVAWVIENQ